MHLDNPELAVDAEVDGDGIDDQRFAGDEFDVEAGLGLQKRGGFGGGRRRGHLRLEFRIGKFFGDGLAHGGDDFFLEAGAELVGPIVIDHRRFALVAAFAENAFRRNVAGDVVGVGIDPNAAGIEFALQAERIVDHDLAGQEDHRELVAEAPGLNHVGQRGLKRFAAIEAGEVFLCVVGNVGAGVLGAGLPFGAGAW